MDSASYLAAMIDGEGAVSCTLRKNGNLHRQVSITNTDEDIVQACERCLSDLEIPYHTYRYEARAENLKPVYYVFCTNREAFEKIAKLPIQAKRKVEVLTRMLASYKS